MHNSSISVVICVYNAQTTIGKCLESLAQQSVPHECIVVDDGSTDKTKEIVKQFTNVALYTAAHQGPAKARNYGVQHASGEIIVFVDADMAFEKNFIEKLILPIQQGKTKGTWTKDELVSNWDNVWAQAWNLEYTHNRSRSRIPPNVSESGPVFRAILKSEFDRVSGFDSIGYTDDWTLAKKLGYQPIAASDAVMYHANPDSAAAVYKQAKWIAKRSYKLGEIGRFIALIRATLPISIINGWYYAVKFNLPFYLWFKIVYDFSICVGILEYWTTGNSSK